MGPGQKFLTRVGSIFCGSGRVSHLWFGLEFGKFPLNMSNFSIFYPLGQKKSLQVGSESTRVKAGSASYLLRVKSKLGSGRVGSWPISSLYTFNMNLFFGSPEVLTVKVVSQVLYKDLKLDGKECG